MEIESPLVCGSWIMRMVLWAKSEEAEKGRAPLEHLKFDRREYSPKTYKMICELHVCYLERT